MTVFRIRRFFKCKKQTIIFTNYNWIFTEIGDHRLSSTKLKTPQSCLTTKTMFLNSRLKWHRNVFSLFFIPNLDNFESFASCEIKRIKKISISSKDHFLKVARRLSWWVIFKICWGNNLKKNNIQQLVENLNTIKYPCWKEILNNRVGEVAVVVVWLN